MYDNFSVVASRRLALCSDGFLAVHVKCFMKWPIKSDLKPQSGFPMGSTHIHSVLYISSTSQAIKSLYN